MDLAALVGKGWLYGKEPAEEKPKHTSFQSRERDEIEKRIAYLASKLGSQEMVASEYEGASIALIKFCAKHKLNYPLEEKTTYSTEDAMARKELEDLYDDKDTKLRHRYWAGRALGRRPIEIYAHHHNRLAFKRACWAIAGQVVQTGMPLKEKVTYRL